MSHTIEAIARATGLRLLGDGSVVVRRPAEPATAAEDELALAMSPAYEQALRGSRARAAVVWEGADPAALGLAAALVAPRPRIALAGITDQFRHPADVAPGIHPTAVVDPEVSDFSLFTYGYPNAVLLSDGRVLVVHPQSAELFELK